MPWKGEDGRKEERKNEKKGKGKMLLCIYKKLQCRIKNNKKTENRRDKQATNGGALGGRRRAEERRKEKDKDPSSSVYFILSFFKRGYRNSVVRDGAIQCINTHMLTSNFVDVSSSSSFTLSHLLF